MDGNIVYGQLFARKANIEYRALLEWSRHLNPITTPGGWIKFNRQTLDNWIAESAHGFESPPTAADIIDGRLQLLTRYQARATLSCAAYATLKRLAQLGKVPTLKLGPRTRLFDAAAVQSLANRPFYLTAEVRKILAVRHWTQLRRAYVLSGKLWLDTDPLDHKRVVVLHDDLVNLLPELLPPNKDPEDWIFDRLVDPEWPMRIKAAAAYTAKPVREIRNLVAHGKLDYIWMPSKKERRIPADALLYHVEQEPLTDKEIGHFYDVNYRTVASWRHAGSLVCSAHHHESGKKLYFACLMAQIKADNPGIQPVAWYKTRLRSKTPLFTAEDAAKLAGTTPAALLSAAWRGEIAGLRTPIGTFRFSTSAIQRFKRYR